MTIITHLNTYIVTWKGSYEHNSFQIQFIIDGYKYMAVPLKKISNLYCNVSFVFSVLHNFRYK